MKAFDWNCQFRTPEALNASDLQSSKDRSSSVDHPSTNTQLQGKSVSLDSVQHQSCSDIKVRYKNY